MSYKYKIIDTDIGGILYEGLFCNDNFDRLVATVRDDLMSWTEDEHVYDMDDEDDYRRAVLDAEYFDTRAIVNDLIKFNWRGGLYEFHVWLPGRHKKFVITMEK